eukprot:gene16190-22016_t
MSEDISENSQSALRENISRKGNNSYYYAHGNTPTGPVWDGKEEPRLIAVNESSKEQLPTIKKNPVIQFDSFSWLDETNNVKVYIDYEKANEIEDDNISVTSTADAVTFSLRNGEKEYVLLLSPLFSTITTTTYKKKSDKFVLTLKKDAITSWMQLKKSS